MAIIVCVDDNSIQADSQAESVSLVWGSAAAWRRSTFIRTGWTLAMTFLWWLHHNCCVESIIAAVRCVSYARKMRTDAYGQVMVMIAVTWLVPAGVFFTSIIGWQYFVGKRTVPAERCYVQYMENALFNCILQVLALYHCSQRCSKLSLFLLRWTIGIFLLWEIDFWLPRADNAMARIFLNWDQL